MSMRAAVNAKCKDCIYDDAEPGTWRMQVEACTSQECALWPIRPRSARKTDDAAASEEAGRP